MIDKYIVNELKSTFGTDDELPSSGYRTVIEESEIDTDICDSEKIILYLTVREGDQCICKKLIIESALYLDGDFYKSGLNAYIETCNNTNYCSISNNITSED